MKTLTISVISKKPTSQRGLLSHTGEISIGEFKEKLILPITWWSLKEYNEQWIDGIKRIAIHDTSCLVTTVQNMETNPLVELWALYKENQRIFVQNIVLFGEYFKSKLHQLPSFDINTCYLYVDPRKTQTNDGFQISEWEISSITLNT